jgi:type II secretory pathway component PulC
MAATSAREWAIAIGGGLALCAALVAILRPAPQTAPDTEPPPVAAAPTPMPAAPAPPAAPVATTDLALTGLRTGPDGGMAIIRAGGRQYRLTPGRTLPGGLALLRTEPGRAILTGPGGEQVLAFPDAPRNSAATPSPTTIPGGDPTPWRLALTAVKDGNMTMGWRLGSLSGLPLLARAGLKTGDILISANGQALASEEKIIDLPQELAMNGRIDLRYRRGDVERSATITP